MPALILSPVEDAESTDLSSLLNVLEFMKDDAFLGKTRVNVELVRKLRSRVKNVWVHAPKVSQLPASFLKIWRRCVPIRKHKVLAWSFLNA